MEMKKHSLDTDLFYLYLSNSAVAFPALKDFIDKLYETQKYHFYETAKSNPYYNHTLMSDRTLEMEVSMKRAFGILLCSDDNEQLHKMMCDEFVKVFPRIKPLMDKFVWTSFQNVVQHYMQEAQKKNMTDDELAGVVFFVAYAIIHKYGLDCEDEDIKKLYDIVEQDVNTRAAFAQSPFVARIDALKVHDMVVVPRYVRKVKDYINCGDHLTSFTEWANSMATGQIPRTKIANDMLKTFAPYITEDDEDFTNAMAFCGILADVMSAEGYSISMLLNGRTISKEEQDRIFKITSNEMGARREEKSALQLQDYIVALLFYMLIKNLKESRNFYFENNSETQFNELLRSQREIDALKEDVAEQVKAVGDKQQYIVSLQKQIEQLTTELAKDTKDAAKPLMGEISLLRSEVSKMQQRLDEEFEKTQELNRLREFVFAMQQGEDITQEEVSLGELIKDKAIYIFGGHINWRNKLKGKYPSLNILDGHNTSFDEQQLLNADIVLLNTSNMSHALYYKVIDVLRKNKIRFDYLGKYINQNLLEREIAEILKRI